MELFNIFWIFLIIVSLVPAINKKIIETTRLRVMREIEQKRGTRVIALIHRQESMSFLGFPMARYIDIQDSEEVLRAIKLTDPKLPLDIILHTPGGLVLATEQIANALCRRSGDVTVFVPHYAMSGGTMIALAADHIVMDENAVLGPVDPQLGQFPAASILKAVEQKDSNRIDDETLILADMARKALKQVQQTIQRLARQTYGEEKAAELANAMATGQWTHDYPICVDEARALGLKVSTDMPEEIYRLMALYPQANTRRPSVEYIPLPYPQRQPSPDRAERKS